jgi:hypothetical protein
MNKLYHSNSLTLLLHKVAHGKLRKSKGTIESDDVIGIVGHAAQQLDAFNEQEVQLGKLQTDNNFKEEVEQALKEEDAKRASADVVCISDYYWYFVYTHQLTKNGLL